MSACQQSATQVIANVHLILQTGTNEITNNSEKTVIEEKVIKLVGLASRLKSENVLKITILNQIKRVDKKANTELAKIFDSKLEEEVERSHSRIFIKTLDLKCNSEEDEILVYGHELCKKPVRTDGIHLMGREGEQRYTWGAIYILKN